MRLTHALLLVLAFVVFPLACDESTPNTPVTPVNNTAPAGGSTTTQRPPAAGNGMVNDARYMQAESGLRVIQTAMTAWRTRYGAYNATDRSGQRASLQTLGVNTGSMPRGWTYSINATSATAYTATATPTSPGLQRVVMTQAGTFSRQ